MAATRRLTRKEQQAQLRERILDSALGVFRRAGYAKATINEVAELAGCTRGAVYLHFGSKADLWVSVLEAHADERVAMFRDAVLAADGDAELLGLLVALGSPSGATVGRSLLDMAMVAEDVLASEDGALLDRVRTLHRKVEDAVRLLIVRLCQTRGVEAPRAPETLTVLMLSLHQGLVQRSDLSPDFDLAGHLSTALDLLLAGERTEAPVPTPRGPQ